MAVRFGVWFDGRRPRSKREVGQEVTFLKAFGFEQVCVLLNDTRHTTETWDDELLAHLLDEIASQGMEPHVMDWVWSDPERLEAQVEVLGRLEKRVELVSYQQDTEEAWRDNPEAVASQAFIEAYQAEGIQTPVGVTGIANLDAPSQHDVEAHIRNLHRAGILHHVAPQAYSARAPSIPWTMKTNLVLPGRTQKVAHAHWGDLVQELGVPVFLGMAGYGQNLFRGSVSASLTTSFRAALALGGDFNLWALWVWSRKHLRRMNKTARALRDLIRDIKASSKIPTSDLLDRDRRLLVDAAGRLMAEGLTHALWSGGRVEP